MHAVLAIFKLLYSLFCARGEGYLNHRQFKIIFPDRYTERSNLEVQLFNIQTKLRASKQKTWYPPEGHLVSDINKVRTYTVAV